ncbi:MAG: cobalamin B12-binding domain-containing protein [Candidatus Hodarchaeales archaeon]|jgi:corrinoid protein of di/trimethylamine methyltransferase
MSNEDTYRQMADSVVNLDMDGAKQLAQKSIDEEMNLLEVIEKGFGEGIRKVGDLWDEGEYFLPELMRGAQIMQEAVDIITPKLKAAGSERESPGKVVLATIEGDIHSIGKTIVGTMLRANGFDVVDLGADVLAEKIVEEAVKIDADIIGVSALLTTTMVNQKKVIEILGEKGKRDKIKVMLGGAPVTEEWIKECQADAYAENAIEAVKVAKSLLGK